MSEKVYFSTEGLTYYRESLQEKQGKVKGMKGAFEEAADGESSVWHDNFAHEQALRDLERHATVARDAAAALSNYQVINIVEQTTRVSIGNTVEIELDDNEVKEITIGAFGESMPAKGLITYQAPLAKILIGKVEGDEVTVRTGKGNQEGSIRKIHPASYRYRQLIAELFAVDSNIR